MGIINNSTAFASKYRLNSSRLPNHDYSSPGYYFITICTYRHNNFFGKIINNQIELSKMGIITNQCLIDIPKHFKNIFIDEFVIMPNHVHLLLNLKQNHSTSLTKTNYGKCRDVAYNVSTELKKVSIENKASVYFSNISPKPNSIPTIIRSFKSAVTHQINPKSIFFAWQSRYHDIIIKNQKQYSSVKNYIKNNVVNWKEDKYFSIS